MNWADLRLFIFDLDGVVYLGREPVPGAKETLDHLTKLGGDIFYVTNNSTRTRMQFQEKLAHMGIAATEGQIVTSAYATACYLNELHEGATVYIIGEEGLITEFKDAGFHVLFKDDAIDAVDFVIVGLDRKFTYQKLSNALSAVEQGAQFVATNDDPTLPTESGLLPGAGTLVAALSNAIGRPPLITIGKPNPFMLNLILKTRKIKPSNAVIIGDRYTTDIKAGVHAQIKTILVKTGVGFQELKEIPVSGPHPDLILDSVADFHKFLSV